MPRIGPGITIGAGVTVTTTPAAVTSGLIMNIDATDPSCYNGSGTTATDLSGNGNNLTVAGAPAFNNTDGWQFPGADVTKYLIRNPFSMPTTATTFEIWIKTSSAVASGLYSYAVTEGDNYFLLFNPASLGLYTVTSNVSSGISVTNGNWIHVARTSLRSTGEEILYINGILAFSTTLVAGTNFISGGSMVFGQEQDAVGGGFDPNQSYAGNLGMWKIFNTVLTGAQVMQNFQATKNKFGY
jgi:hypothetical protein